jgi:hypothetical protein
MNDRDGPANWMTTLVRELGRAVRAGNAQTARWIALLAVARLLSRLSCWSAGKNPQPKDSV